MSVTLLDLDGADMMCGGIALDEVGESVVRTEGPLHPRVGTVVSASPDIEDLPDGTLAECEGIRTGHAYLVQAHPEGWVDTQEVGRVGVSPRSLVSSFYVIGATILYVPMGEP